MPDRNFDYDVFISYSTRDKEWVRGELLRRIEAAGIKALIDFRDFTRGAWGINEMTRAVSVCRKTLLILTPSYIDSEWCEHERLIVQTLSAANRDLRLLPLLRVECELPPSVQGITHIDFTDGADHDLAWRQLLTALGKPPEPQPPTEPRRDQWFLAHPYPMPPNFTGRLAERALLSRWLDEDAAHPLLSLRALGGFGKSALVWHWLTHDVRPDAWPRVVWWSFYEDDASFDNFLVETLGYLSGGDMDTAKLTGKLAVEFLLQALRTPGTLLVLDGFERVLRAFAGLDAPYQGDKVSSEASDCDCISPLAELFLRHLALQPDVRSKVVLTTRLCPRALAPKGELLVGAREEPVAQMQPDDAVAFFQAQGIRGTRMEINTACATYGFHPLSLRLLAGLIVRSFQQSGDIAAARRLDVTGDLVQRQHHVLQAAYDRLPPSRQVLLSRIACFRGSVTYDTLRAVSGAECSAPGERDDRRVEGAPFYKRPARAVRELDEELHDLASRGLLHHDPQKGRFDLHPVVRRYVYDRLTSRKRAALHSRLRNHFAAVPTPTKIERLEDLAPVIELYHHTARAGRQDEAYQLYRNRLNRPLFYQFGTYQLIIDLLRPLFPDGEDTSPRLKGELEKACALNDLANGYSLIGQPLRAMPLFERQTAISENNGHKSLVATGLGNLAAQQVEIGALRTAEANQRRSIELCREIKDDGGQAGGQHELGYVLALRGAYTDSAEALDTALKMFMEQNHVQYQSSTWTYYAIRELLKLRQAESGDNRQPRVLNSPVAVAPARRALELADETANNPRFVYPVRDYVRAHWLLGAAHRVAGQPGEAGRHLDEALERCRRINNVEHEADILIDLARLRAGMSAADEAQQLIQEALLITERSGYVLRGADAHIELARLALARGDRTAARNHAEEAHRLATCGGPPDYTYAAAYAESAALLAQL